MPLLHCKKCQHEYEASNAVEKCNWCGSGGFVLQEKTSLERMVEILLDQEDMPVEFQRVVDENFWDLLLE